jgi:cellulose biosynthesis protein BcsQ
LFVNDERLEALESGGESKHTVFSPLVPLLKDEGGIAEPYVEDVEGIGLLIGDLELSGLDDELSKQWAHCLSGESRAFRVICGFHTVLTKAARARSADIVLVDVGPNLGSINRAALIAADAVVIPLAPDLVSLKGLENLGPQLREWQHGWQERLAKKPAELTDVPAGTMQPLGYVVMQHAVRQDRPVKAYERFMRRIPMTYQESVLNTKNKAFPTIAEDEHCLATLWPYGSLMSLAQQARKPMFHLKAADGAIGAHGEAVRRCQEAYEHLARNLADKAGIALP